MQRITKVAIAAIAVGVILFVTLFLWVWHVDNADKLSISTNVEGSIATSATTGAPKRTISYDELRAKLPDYGVLVPKQITDKETVDRLRSDLSEALAKSNREALDLAINTFLLEKGVSRYTKISVLLDLVKQLNAEDQASYLIDVVAALRPIEFSKELVELFNREGGTQDLRGHILLALGEAFLFSPSVVPNASTVSLLNKNIAIIQEFLKNQSVSSDEYLRGLALAEYLRTIPQSEADSYLREQLGTRNFSIEEKIRARLQVGMLGSSSLQYSILKDILSNSEKSPEVATVVMREILAIASGGGATDILTQDSKYALQAYLREREPRISNELMDPITSAAEFNEWLVALATVSSANKTDAYSWIANYIRMSNDPLKIAAALVLGNSEVINSLRYGGSLSVVSVKLNSARINSTPIERQIIDEALVLVQN